MLKPLRSSSVFRVIRCGFLFAVTVQRALWKQNWCLSLLRGEGARHIALLPQASRESVRVLGPSRPWGAQGADSRLTGSVGVWLEA